jgi:hypothetical protein
LGLLRSHKFANEQNVKEANAQFRASKNKKNQKLRSYLRDEKVRCE